MKTQCFRCNAEFACKPSAHPPRFCDPCNATLQAHATGKEKAAQNRRRYEAAHIDRFLKYVGE